MTLGGTTGLGNKWHYRLLALIPVSILANIGSCSPVLGANGFRQPGPPYDNVIKEKLINPLALGTPRTLRGEPLNPMRSIERI